MFFENSKLSWRIINDVSNEFLKNDVWLLDVVLLDDRFFNQDQLKKGERFLRSLKNAYYYRVHENLIYDQFEIFKNKERILLSRPLALNFNHVERVVHSFKTQPFHSRSHAFWGLGGDVLDLPYDTIEYFLQIESVVMRGDVDPKECVKSYL